MIRSILTFFTLIICFQLIADEWVEKNSYPGVPRHHPVTWGIGDYGYLLTGGNSQNVPLDDFYKYDATNDSWEQLPDFPGTARAFSIGAVYNDIGYIGFGATSTDYLDDLWSYDPVTEQWNQLASCPCLGRQHPAFIAHNGKIFVGLGNHNQNLKDWWVYEIELDSWRQLDDLPGPPRHHPYHFAVGDYVYAGLGHGNGPGINIYNDWYKFDPENETWTTLNNHPGEERVAGSQFSHGNYGYVLSGDGNDHSYMDTGEFWQYDPETDTWIEFDPHPNQSRWAPNAFVVHDTVYFTSGVSKFAGTIHNDVWAYTLPEIEEDVVSVKDLSDKLSFNIFPNPTHDFLTLEISNADYSDLQISIYDIKGQLVKESSFQNRLNVSHLNKGTYILRVQSAAGIKSEQKFTKQ